MNSFKEQPLLTVAIPVYNMEKFLPRCMDSVMKQTLYDMEVVIVNDGSTDDSANLLKKYANDDKRIRVIEQENKGLIVSREVAIEYAKGEYITFLDPDDWVDAEYYQNIISFMRKNDLDIGIGVFKLSFDNYEKNIFDNREKVIMDSNMALANMLLYKNYRWELWDKIYKSSIMKDIKIDPSVTCGEDLLRNFFAFKRADNIGLIPLYGYHYYQRMGSMSKNNNVNYVDTVSRVFDILERYLKDCDNNVCKAFRYRREYFAVHDIYRLIKAKKYYDNYPDIMRVKTYVKNNIKDIILSSLPFKTKFLAIIFSIMK